MHFCLACRRRILFQQDYVYTPIKNAELMKNSAKNGTRKNSQFLSSKSKLKMLPTQFSSFRRLQKQILQYFWEVVWLENAVSCPESYTVIT